ncbi:MAG: carotenoid biosynthesis protein [Bacteroidota bacterium]
MTNLCCNAWQHYSWVLLLPSYLLILLIILIGIKTLNAIHSIFLFIISLLIAATCEWISLTLFPFDGHIFSSQLGPKIGVIPIVVWLAWPFLIFLCFMATEFLFFQIKRKASLALKSILDGLWALSMDLLIDPIQQFEKNWYWPGGGMLFGVPILNFLGWMGVVGLTTYLFRLFLQKRKSVLQLDGIGYTLIAVFVIIYVFFLYSTFYWGLWQAALLSMLVLLVGILIFISTSHPSRH